MTNLEKCLEFMGDKSGKSSFNNVVLGITSEEELMFKLNLIPEASKNCIIAKWGLDGSKICSSYKALNAKLGVSNSKDLYTKALTELAQTRWLITTSEDGSMHCIYQDYSSEDYEQALRHALLRFAVYLKIEQYDGTVDDLKKETEDSLNKIHERERNILKVRFGFYDGKNKKLEETGKMFNTTRERIRQIEAKALRKLRVMKWSYTK